MQHEMIRNKKKLMGMLCLALSLFLFSFLFLPSSHAFEDHHGFQVYTDKEAYFLGQTVLVSINAPDNTTLRLNISGPGQSELFETQVYSSAALVFIPEAKGIYSITADMENNGSSIIKTGSFEVKEKMACKIVGSERVTQNNSVKIKSEVHAGNSPYHYEWQLPDAKTYKTSSFNYRFEDLGTYEILLRIKDNNNDMAQCSFEVEVIERKFDVKVIAKDEGSKARLGDCLVEIEGMSAKTNVDGLAKFNGLAADEYRIKAKREGYLDYSARFDIAADREITINLTPKTENRKLLPTISIYNLEDGKVLNNEELKVSFSVASDYGIDRCMLLANQHGLSGYSVEDTINNVSDGDKTLKAMLFNGDFTIRIGCENEYGMAYSERYDIYGVGFPKDSDTALIDFPVSDDASDDIASAGSGNKDSSDVGDADDAVQAKKDQATADIDDAIGKLENAQRYVGLFAAERKEIADTIGLEKAMEEYLAKLQKLRQQSSDLETLKLTPSSYESQKSNIKTQFNDMVGKIPLDFEIKDKDSYIEIISEQETEAIMQEYIEAKGFEFSDRQVRRLVKKSIEIQQDILTYADLFLVEVAFVDGSKKTYSVVKKRYEIGSLESSGFMLENIPKEFAESATIIKSDTQFEVVKYDPVIKFDVSLGPAGPIRQKGKELAVLYYVEAKKDFSVMTKAKSSFILDPNHPGNSITGFSFFGDTPMIDGGMTLFLSIFVLVAISSGFVFIGKKTGNFGFSSGYGPKSQKDPKGPGWHDKAGPDKNPAQDNAIHTNRPGNDQPIDVLSGSTQPGNIHSGNTQSERGYYDKKIVGIKDGLVQGGKANEGQVNECVRLLEAAIMHLKAEKDREAVSLYPAILKNYSSLGERSKNELKPIILYLSSLVDVQYLNKMLERAMDEIVSGMYNQSGNLFKDIEDCYTNIPKKFMHKVQSKYERYSQMLNMKNLRQDGKLNQMLRRESQGYDAEHDIDDQIFGN